MTIDPSLLPKTACIDTGVMIRAIGECVDVDSVSSSELLEGLVHHRRPIFLPAPALAEILRRDAPSVPLSPTITVVAFDAECARILGERLPDSAIRKAQSATGQPRQCLKVDAFIVATAIRYRAEVLVTVDPGMVQLAEHARIRCVHPQDFQEKQLTLP